MKKMKKLVIVLLINLTCSPLFCQNLDDILELESMSDSSFVMGTFKGTRLMNGHSIETRQKGVLEFIIQHRFGRINTGSYEFFGLDESNIRLGLEYAINDNLGIAIGRSSFEKVFDGYIKYRLLKQKTAKKSSPISFTLFGSVANKTLKDYDPEDKPAFKERLAFTSQILLARKINQDLSIQLSPTYVHFNHVSSSNDPNDIFALGIGTRIKIGNHISLNGEYYYSFDSFESRDTKNSLGIGFDIETGGHVFQLILTNSRAMVEKGFITETTGDFFNGDIHFGFNISRDFYLNSDKPEEKLY